MARWLKIADRQGRADVPSAGPAGGVVSWRRRTGASPAHRAAGAEERKPSPCDGLLRPRCATKMMYPLVLDLAADGIAPR